MVQKLKFKLEYLQFTEPCINMQSCRSYKCNMSLQGAFNWPIDSTDWGYEMSSRKWNRGRNGLHQVGQPVAPFILFLDDVSYPQSVGLLKSLAERKTKPPSCPGTSHNQNYPARECGRFKRVSCRFAGLFDGPIVTLFLLTVKTSGLN